MRMNRNYSKELDEILCKPENKGKRLFLHSCCAPCSSYVLEYLRPFFQITVFYYNPNITEEPEYRHRVEEQKRLICEFNRKLEMSRKPEIEGASEDRAKSEEKEAYPIQVIEGDYSRELFFERVRGLEDCPEGGQRCFVCYELRLLETALRAKEQGADYFTTTLTISPLKNAAKINEIGERIAGETGVAFLPSDFKKKNGYKRSVELSKEYDLYRQNYCGCIYSREQ